MVWSYNQTLLASTPLYQVRRLIGDVIISDQQIADEEISFSLTQRPSIYGAAAECCRYIAAQYSRNVNVVTAGAGGSMTTNYSQKAIAYAKMAADFEMKAAIMGGALPYAGGISVSDKQNVEGDGDRVAPQYNLGMMDDLDNPEGAVGNQTPGTPSSVSSE